MVYPLVYHYLGVAAVVVDTIDRMVDYGETSSLDKGFSIPKMKESVVLDAVPMNSKGSDISLQVVNVGATMY